MKLERNGDCSGTKGNVDLFQKRGFSGNRVHILYYYEIQQSYDLWLFNCYWFAL